MNKGKASAVMPNLECHRRNRWALMNELGEGNDCVGVFICDVCEREREKERERD